VSIAWIGWHFERDKERQAEQHQTIASSIAALQSSDPSARVVAASLLASYVDDSRDQEIVSALTARAAVEDDPAVFAQVIEALGFAGTRVIPNLVKVNRALVRRLGYASGEFLSTGRKHTFAPNDPPRTAEESDRALWLKVRVPSIFGNQMLSNDELSALIKQLQGDPLFEVSFKRALADSTFQDDPSSWRLSELAASVSNRLQELADMSPIFEHLIAQDVKPHVKRDFSETVLLHINLMRANLRSYDFQLAVLPGIELAGADLRCTELGGVDLRGAVGVSGATFAGANIHGAKMPVAGQAYDSIFPNFSGTDWKNAEWVLAPPDELERRFPIGDSTQPLGRQIDQYLRVRHLCEVESISPTKWEITKRWVYRLFSPKQPFDSSTEPK
jgi:hypothetical protein